jgi:hypothetical protein
MRRALCQQARLRRPPASSLRSSRHQPRPARQPQAPAWHQVSTSFTVHAPGLLTRAMLLNILLCRPRVWRICRAGPASSIRGRSSGIPLWQGPQLCLPSSASPHQRTLQRLWPALQPGNSIPRAAGCCGALWSAGRGSQQRAIYRGLWAGGRLWAAVAPWCWVWAACCTGCASSLQMDT